MKTFMTSCIVLHNMMVEKYSSDCEKNEVNEVQTGEVPIGGNGTPMWALHLGGEDMVLQPRFIGAICGLYEITSNEAEYCGNRLLATDHLWNVHRS